MEEFELLSFACSAFRMPKKSCPLYMVYELWKFDKTSWTYSNNRVIPAVHKSFFLLSIAKKIFKFDKNPTLYNNNKIIS